MIRAEEARKTITESKAYKEEQKKRMEAENTAIEKEYKKICKKIEKAVNNGYFSIDVNRMDKKNAERFAVLGYSIRQANCISLFTREFGYRISW